MKASRLIITLMLATGLYGCYSIEARYSFDSETDFSGLSSYAWLELDKEIFSTPESAEHYVSAMNEMLASKGFDLNPEDPDFQILTESVETYREKYTTLNGTVDFPKAMLRVDFLNASSGEVIYEAASDAYFDPNATQAAKNAIIDKGVKALLSEFPPDG